MTDLTVGVTAYELNGNHPSRRYGQPSPLALANGSQDVLFRASVAKIPTGATVTSAVVTFYQTRSTNSTRTFTVIPANGKWSSRVTWSSKPPTSGTAVNVSNPASPDNAAISFDVTAHVQAIVAGTATDRGWLLTTGEASVLRLHGTPATTLPPVMVVTYSMLPDAPDNLHPASGSVSVAKPVLTFDTGDDVTSIQVQVDPAANPTTPGFDSGEVVASGGLLDLSTTTYAGLAAGSSTQWRARQKNGFGWSEWSDWATFTFTAKGTPAFTAPTAGTIYDGTPPTQWTFSGTQTAWQVIFRDASAKVLADSGRTAGTATAWTPDRGLATDGATGSLELRVWDDVDRTATPGDPVYASVTEAVTLTLDGTVGPMDTLLASLQSPAPGVAFTGSRAAGIPDEVALFRDDVEIARVAGTDVFSGTGMSGLADWTAPMGRQTTYRVAPVVNGHVASGGPAVTVTPSAPGIWLLDADTPADRVVVWGNDAQVQAQPETSIVHSPLSDASGVIEAVRRRIVRMPPQGTIVGTLADVTGFPSASACEALLDAWTTYDAGHTFRLVLGGLNVPVIVGDITLNEAPGPRVDRALAASINWWGRADA
ncbi:MAG: DNRLRE domain-containing protein [Sciscionella sp.]